MNAVETANLNMETVKVMKEASDVMKGMNKRIGINDVDETMYAHPSHPSPKLGYSRIYSSRLLTSLMPAGRRSARTCNTTRRFQLLSAT